MGIWRLCRCCFGRQSTKYDDADPEERRQKLLEAAEKRRAANDARGVKDPDCLARRRRQQRIKDEQELLKLDHQGGLKWSVG